MSQVTFEIISNKKKKGWCLFKEYQNFLLLSQIWLWRLIYKFKKGPRSDNDAKIISVVFFIDS